MILPLCCLLWHLATPAWAQETLSLKECREMALKYNYEYYIFKYNKSSTAHW